eukprot:TRINITY_DN8862_c0_g1_i1.p1 TRINITY_DN8862_c0_g1~~TRINITY_DN8862_c0_g1_i1.p1  ORF type:complete len:367 (+),score=144.75 TRINITY_DN8862_c0_g1_i1:44-1144(+)
MDMFDDAFGSAPSATAAQPDPAADFINREQTDLGDLGMDFGLTSAPAPAPAMGTEGDGTTSFFESSTNNSSDMNNGLGDLTGSGMPDFTSSATSDSSGMPDFGIMSGTAELAGSTLTEMSDIGSMGTTTNAGMPDIGDMASTTNTGVPDIRHMASTTSSGMPDFGGMATTTSSDMPDFAGNGIAEVPSSGMPDYPSSGMPDATSSGMADFSSENIGSGLGRSEVPAVGAADPIEEGGPFETFRVNPRQSGEEPECLRKWREDQKEIIRIKDEEEDRKKEELRQRAKKELESFYKNYEEELQLTKKENRIAEEAFLADVNGLKPGTEWERVCRNSNFNSKVIHNKKDRSRMRNVLLQLKQTPLMNRE